MSRPRVFVSSTYYDLKHIRASLDAFIESLGFDPVLSENGDITYTPDLPLDESCYREASNADIFVLIIGGRYGSKASSEKQKHDDDFYDRYNSITKKEHESARKKDIPIYILIDNNVYAEYRTYCQNKNLKIEYAHVDDVNVFCLIEEILAKPRNNPMQTFDRASEIEAWLREQWAGLFRELLRHKSQERQLSTLADQVDQLSENNKSLKNYLEAIMKNALPDEADELIESEQARLIELRNRKVLENLLFRNLNKLGWNLTIEQFLKALRESDTIDDFIVQLPYRGKKSDKRARQKLEGLMGVEILRNKLDDVRDLLGLAPFKKYNFTQI